MVIKRIDSSVEITLFRSGLHFLNSVPNNADGFFPDIIFLDIRMPELNGFDVLDRLVESYSEKLSKTKIFVLSSTLDERDLSRAVSYNIVTEFMSKPLTFEHVAKLLSS